MDGNILREFWERHLDPEQQLKAWYEEAGKAEWKSQSGIKRGYPSAGFFADYRVVFNINFNPESVEEWHEHALRLMAYYPQLYTDIAVMLWVEPNTQRTVTPLIKNAKHAG